MTIYRQGEIVLVPYPYTDMSGAKKRPAVIVSANWYNDTRPDYILVPLTSTVRSSLERDQVLIQGAEIRLSGLRTASIVNVGKIFTIEQGRILRSLGRLTAATQEKVLSKLSEVLKDV